MKYLDGLARMENKFKYTAEEIRREIEDVLHKVGFLCRVFARGKSQVSLDNKLNKDEGKYCKNGKTIQDAIGIRVALYFEEDIDIVAKMLRDKYEIDKASSTIDNHATDQFNVTRHNLIFRLPDMYISDMQRIIGAMPIDTSFEIQLRSILSEGWHEVDHDLRYKTKSSWDQQDDLSRAFNGILATLETAEWGMRRIFDDLAYRHYKMQNWENMLHHKIRLRIEPRLSDEIICIFQNDNEFAKDVFRLNRKHVIDRLSKLKPSLPLSLDNIVYVWNYIGPKNKIVLESTPALILDALARSDSTG